MLTLKIKIIFCYNIIISLANSLLEQLKTNGVIICILVNAFNRNFIIFCQNYFCYFQNFILFKGNVNGMNLKRFLT